MKPLTKEERSLCIQALRAYGNELIEQQAELGNLTQADQDKVYQMFDLSDRLEEEQ